MTESFYDLLGVPTDADTEEIERAYRQRIKETHPDVNDAADASEQTARIVEARDVLTDEAERARYDRIGHEAYVGGDAGPDPAQGAGPGPNPDGSATGNAGSTRDGAGSASSSSNRSSSSGPTNARAGAEERRRRERRARRDVDFGTGSGSAGPGSSGSSATGGGSATASSGSTAASSASAAANGGATATGGAGLGGDDARSRTEPTEPPSWSDTSEGWAARRPTDPPPGLASHVVAALQQAPATAIVTFLLYPLVVLGAFFPGFPLTVNVVVGACLLAMIAAAQSVPGLGIAIYGTWSLLAPIGLLWTGSHPFSPLGLIMLGTTWLPLGFSLLTYKVLDA